MTSIPDRELEFSPLSGRIISGRITRDGCTVLAHIYLFAGTEDEWTLEVVDHDDGHTIGMVPSRTTRERMKCSSKQ